MYGEISGIVWEGEGPYPEDIFAKHNLSGIFEDSNGIQRAPTPADVGTEKFEELRAWYTGYLIDKAQDYEQRQILDCNPARFCLDDGQTWL